MKYKNKLKYIQIIWNYIKTLKMKLNSLKRILQNKVKILKKYLIAEMKRKRNFKLRKESVK